MTKFIISFCVAFAVSVLSGLGVGGGGLFVIYLALFTDTPQITAQGLNLLFFLFSAGGSLTVHLRRRRIFGTAVGVMAAAGVAGAVVGSLLSGLIAQSLLRKIFGCMLVTSGILSLKTKKNKPSVSEPNEK